MIGVEGGDSCGISGTGETPQWSKATEEAHRPPHGKRPPGTEINIVPSNWLTYHSNLSYSFLCIQKLKSI
ncbi:hypothetical protein E2C16_11410 [Sporosarcina pasteurii]|nr:hypothetical protein E2C16_11410 [Sporosarcina pasteurii]